MAKLKLTGVAGTDTESEFVLSIDNVVIDHTLITRARLHLIDSALTLDSNSYPAAWDFSHAGKLLVRLGRGDLVAGHYRGRLITYDINHANGIAWDAELEMTIL